jgi:hypothetical protein
VERHTEIGSQPAQTTPGRSAASGRSCQIRSTAAAVSAGNRMAPPSGSVQVCPRSSEWTTVGPKCSERTPIISRVRPSRVSMPMLGTSVIRKCGGESVQVRRSSLVASQRPFRVPIASSVVVMHQ